jgi:hypothetical protein
MMLLWIKLDSFIPIILPNLNPICHLLALGAHHILHVGRIRVKYVEKKFTERQISSFGRVCFAFESRTGFQPHNSLFQRLYIPRSLYSRTLVQLRHESQNKEKDAFMRTLSVLPNLFVGILHIIHFNKSSSDTFLGLLGRVTQ